MWSCDVANATYHCTHNYKLTNLYDLFFDHFSGVEPAA